MHGRSYWNGFVGRLWQHPAETGSRSKERTQLSCLVLSHCLAHCGQGNACSPKLSCPLGLAAGIWPGVLGHSATSSHYLCRTWVLLCQQNTSVARIHQFPDVFFSEFFFFLWCCLSLFGTEFSNHVIYQVPTLCHIEGLVIDTFALTSACTVVFSVCSPVFGCV